MAQYSHGKIVPSTVEIVQHHLKDHEMLKEEAKGISEPRTKSDAVFNDG